MNGLLTLAVALALLYFPAQVYGAGDDKGTPKIRPGTVEVGVSGALTAIEGVTNASLAMRSGMFFKTPAGLTGVEAEISYSHIRSLDIIDLQGFLNWQTATADGWVYPFIAIGGGLRQEWLGSFSQARFPIGATLGLRFLFSTTALLRVEYDVRRVLSDPVADFTEHGLNLGVSILLRNRE